MALYILVEFLSVGFELDALLIELNDVDPNKRRQHLPSWTPDWTPDWTLSKPVRKRIPENRIPYSDAWVQPIYSIAISDPIILARPGFQIDTVKHISLPLNGAVAREAIATLEHQSILGYH